MPSQPRYCNQVRVTESHLRQRGEGVTAQTGPVSQDTIVKEFQFTFVGEVLDVIDYITGKDDKQRS